VSWHTAGVLVVIIAAFALYHRFDAAGQAREWPSSRHLPDQRRGGRNASVPKFLSGIGTLQAVRQVTVAPEVGV